MRIFKQRLSLAVAFLGLVGGVVGYSLTVKDLIDLGPPSWVWLSGGLVIFGVAILLTMVAYEHDMERRFANGKAQAPSMGSEKLQADLASQRDVVREHVSELEHIIGPRPSTQPAVIESEAPSHSLPVRYQFQKWIAEWITGEQVINDIEPLERLDPKEIDYYTSLYNPFDYIRQLSRLRLAEVALIRLTCSPKTVPV